MLGRRLAILVSGVVLAAGSVVAEPAKAKKESTAARGIASLPPADEFGAFRLGTKTAQPYGFGDNKWSLGGAELKFGNRSEPSAEWFREMYMDNPTFLKQIGLEPGKLYKVIQIKVGSGN